MNSSDTHRFHLLLRLVAVGVTPLLASCTSRPSRAPELPRDLALICEAVQVDPAGRTPMSWEAFVSRGSSWRLEIWSPDDERRVVISDGDEIAVHPPVDAASSGAEPWGTGPEDTLFERREDESFQDELARLDPRPGFRAAYAGLENATWRGRAEVNGHSCLVYELRNEIEVLVIWIDEESGVPRRKQRRRGVFVEDVKYHDFPADFTVRDELFVTTNDQPMLLLKSNRPE